MADKVAVLVLRAAGTGGCLPDPLDWKPKKNKRAAILNASGAEQELSNLTDDMLVDEDGNSVSSVTIAANGFWLGEVAKKGEYTYQDGTAQAAPRTGTIDPS